MNDATQHPEGQPWQWSEPTWRRIVGRARAGRSLKPKAWPDGARCASVKLMRSLPFPGRGGCLYYPRRLAGYGDKRCVE